MNISTTKSEARQGLTNSDLLSLSDEMLAHVICEACGEEPMDIGDCRGNDWRWQDYMECIPQFWQSVRHYIDSGENVKLSDG